MQQRSTLANSLFVDAVTQPGPAQRLHLDTRGGQTRLGRRERPIRYDRIVLAMHQQ